MNTLNRLIKSTIFNTQLYFARSEMPYQITFPRPDTYLPLRNPAFSFNSFQTMSSHAAIRLDQPAELLGAFDLAGEWEHGRVVFIFHRERPVAYRLMGPFDVVVALYKFIDQVLKMVLAEDDEVIEENLTAQRILSPQKREITLELEFGECCVCGAIRNALPPGT